MTQDSKPAERASTPVLCDAYKERQQFEAGLFDGLEIQPIASYEQEDGTTWCEPCSPEEAEFWSAYGHLKEGGVFCIGDFATESLARAYAEAVSAAWGLPIIFG